MTRSVHRVILSEAKDLFRSESRFFLVAFGSSE